MILPAARLLSIDQDFPETYFPMLWVEEGAEVPDSVAETFASGVYTLLAITSNSKWAG